MSMASVIRMLPGGIPQREPTQSELDFFRLRPDVGGLAADDGAVVISPCTTLSNAQLSAVALNEAARVVMSSNLELRPTFRLTAEQRVAFKDYGPLDAVRATIAARLLSSDRSALTPTLEQLKFVRRLAEAMHVAPPFDGAIERALR